MWKAGVVFISLMGCAVAEVHSLTLRQAVERALAQNPDLVLARLEEQKAAQQIQVARDPFLPKVFFGSGLAYSSGFPLSIEGAAPSIVQARAVASVFNRPQSYQLAQARENAKGAELDTLARQEGIALETTELYLRADLAAKNAGMARRQIEGLEKVAETIRLRVAEGRELPLERKRAALDIARARQRAEVLDSDRIQAEGALAMVLGYAPNDRVQAAGEERIVPDMPASEDAAVETALNGSREIRRLESALIAKGFEVQAHKSARLPRIDLVAQYGLFARFNNYEDFFQRFERHNGQIGVSFQIPLLTGSASDALAAQAEAESTRLRTQIGTAKSRIALDARKAYQEVQKAETSRQVASLDLEVARENLSLLLARMEEGRAGLREVEAARYVENDKWITFYEARHALELARFDLLKQTGQLVAALR